VDIEEGGRGRRGAGMHSIGKYAASQEEKDGGRSGCEDS